MPAGKPRRRFWERTNFKSFGNPCTNLGEDHLGLLVKLPVLPGKHHLSIDICYVYHLPTRVFVWFIKEGFGDTEEEHILENATLPNTLVSWS